jgi:hypothetical protein
MFRTLTERDDLMDFGDVVAAKTQDIMLDVLRLLARKTPGAIVAGGKTLHDLILRRKAKLEQSIAEQLGIDSKSKFGYDPDNPDNANMRVYIGETPDADAAIGEILNSCNASYTCITEKVDIDGLGEVEVTVWRVPDEQFAPQASFHLPFSHNERELKPALIHDEAAAALNYFNLDDWLDHMASCGVFAELNGKVNFGGLEIDEEQDLGNVTLGFTTKKFDPQARILTDPLSKAGIPFQLEHDADGHVLLTVPFESAPFLKKHIDYHLKNTVYFNEGRFDDLSVLTNPPTSCAKTPQPTSSISPMSSINLDEAKTTGRFELMLDAKGMSARELNILSDKLDAQKISYIEGVSLSTKTVIYSIKTADAEDVDAILSDLVTDGSNRIDYRVALARVRESSGAPILASEIKALREAISEDIRFTVNDPVAAEGLKRALTREGVGYTVEPGLDQVALFTITADDIRQVDPWAISRVALRVEATSTDEIKALATDVYGRAEKIAKETDRAQKAIKADTKVKAGIAEGHKKEALSVGATGRKMRRSADAMARDGLVPNLAQTKGRKQ